MFKQEAQLSSNKKERLTESDIIHTDRESEVEIEESVSNKHTRAPLWARQVVT